MNLSLRRLLSVSAAATIVALVVAGIVRHAKHGFAMYVGDVAWSTFLIGVLITIALALGVLVKVACNRHTARLEAR